MRVMTTHLDRTTLEPEHEGYEDTLKPPEIARLAEGFCPLPIKHPERRLLISPLGWAYCDVTTDPEELYRAWKLES